jgi:hypothetical protein
MTAEQSHKTDPRHQSRGRGPARGPTRHHRGAQADDAFFTCIGGGRPADRSDRLPGHDVDDRISNGWQ